jgi:hypothetical protein
MTFKIDFKEFINITRNEDIYLYIKTRIYPQNELNKI